MSAAKRFPKVFGIVYKLRAVGRWSMKNPHIVLWNLLCLIGRMIRWLWRAKWKLLTRAIVLPCCFVLAFVCTYAGTMKPRRATVDFFMNPDGAPTVSYPFSFLRPEAVHCNQYYYDPARWRCVIEEDAWLSLERIFSGDLDSGRVIVKYGRWGDGRCWGYEPHIIYTTMGRAYAWPRTHGCHEFWEVWVEFPEE